MQQCPIKRGLSLVAVLTLLAHLFKLFYTHSIKGILAAPEHLVCIAFSCILLMALTEKGLVTLRVRDSDSFARKAGVFVTELSALLAALVIGLFIGSKSLGLALSKGTLSFSNQAIQWNLIFAYANTWAGCYAALLLHRRLRR